MNDTAMDPTANPKNKDDGNFDVWLSIIPVTLSSLCPVVLVSIKTSHIKFDF